MTVQDASERSEQEPTPAAPAVPPARQLMSLVVGMWWSRAVAVAAELGVADQLVHGPQEVAALAGATRAHAPSLYRLLRGLSGAGVFAEVGPGVFAQTPLSALLRAERGVWAKTPGPTSANTPAPLKPRSKR